MPVTARDCSAFITQCDTPFLADILTSWVLIRGYVLYIVYRFLHCDTNLKLGCVLYSMAYYIRSFTVLLPITLADIDRFLKFFHCWICQEICNRWLLHCPSHLKRVAALPYEMTVVTNKDIFILKQHIQLHQWQTNVILWQSSNASYKDCSKCPPFAWTRAQSRERNWSIVSSMMLFSRLSHASIKCCFRSSTSRTFAW